MANRSQQKKLQAMGCTVQVHDDHVTTFWPMYSLQIHGVNITEAISQMEAAQVLKEYYPDATFRHSPDNLRMVNLEHQGLYLSDSYKTPHELLVIMENGGGFDQRFDLSALMPGEQDPEQIEPEQPADVERINGIPTNGAIAHKEGIASGDCPYDTEENYEEFERWNREWDEAADAAEEEEEPSGSVVKDKFRARYAELGHPSHCGDWLADILNNLLKANGQTDMERCKAIYEANGVDMSKYKTSGNGWQGRYRMTGRNKLAKLLFDREFLLAPGLNGEMEQYPVPAEWKATQRFVKAA